MIPYDDLVLALQEWRALKGLPVAQLSGALTPPPVIAAPPKAAPPRPAAPAAPAPPSKSAPQQRAAAPPPPRGQRQAVQALDETIDEDSLLDDSEHLAAHDDGGNFAMQFDPNATLHEGEEDAGDSTSVGTVPARGGDMDATNPHGDPTLPRTPPNRNDDW
jgi:hypothetical protein